MSLKTKELVLNGASICPGIAIGKPFIFTFMDEVIPEFSISIKEIEDEIARYRTALVRSKRDILRLQKQLEADGAMEAAAVLGTHLQIMQDPLLTTHIEKKIRETRKNTEYIFNSVIKEYEEKFNKISDKFFRERFKDIQDVSHRILGHLRKSVRMSLADIPKNSIVFARELVPSDIAEAKSLCVAAFVTESGGETSHAAIVAKAKGIPYVTSVDFHAIEKMKGSYIIVDGRRGEIILNPSCVTLAKYRDIKDQLQGRYESLERKGIEKAETVDGYKVILSANVENTSDLDKIHEYGGSGIGLFRSEYMFFPRDNFPSEDEQFGVYRELAEKMNNLPVVIRTFDVGGDKFADLEHFVHEVNPFLGCRAIRFMLKERDLFMVQLRAILRASAYGNVKIMFPMISGNSELLEAHKLVEVAKCELSREGVKFDKEIEVGCMIEVPSAAIVCDILAEEVDFFSIGTNDLVQYSLAVDRGNQSMSYLYCPTDPSVIRLIKMIVFEGNRSGIPVSICGEIAADPRFTALLLGLGVHELSVAVRYIPIIKNTIRATSIVEANQLVERILAMSSSYEIQEALVEDYEKRMGDEDIIFSESGELRLQTVF